jgi:hypothetical protein
LAVTYLLIGTLRAKVKNGLLRKTWGRGYELNNLMVFLMKEHLERPAGCKSYLLMQ